MIKFSTKSLLSEDEMENDIKWNIQNGNNKAKGISEASDAALALLAAAAALA